MANINEPSLADVLREVQAVAAALQNLSTRVERTEAGLQAVQGNPCGEEGGQRVAHLHQTNRRVPHQPLWVQVQEDESSDEEEAEILGENLNPRGNRLYRQDEFRLKADLPSFNGNFNIEEFLDWMAEVERFFEYAEIPDHKQVKLVAYRLKGGASSWWEQMQVQRRRLGKQPIRLWPKMKRMLMARFLPPDYDQFLFHRYQTLIQGQKSVSEYTTNFLRLSSRNNLVETEGQQVAIPYSLCMMP